METQKIVNLLSDSDNESLKFATRKRYIFNDQNNGKKVHRMWNFSMFDQWEKIVLKSIILKRST